MGEHKSDRKAFTSVHGDLISKGNSASTANN